jgi:hypothetical protein
MKMTISNLLGWCGKRKKEDERRKGYRVIADGPMRVYWCVEGGFPSACGTLRDAAEDGSGIGFALRKHLPIGTVAWLTTQDGQTFGGVVRHADEKAGEYQTGIQLDLESNAVGGWGGVQLHWIDRRNKMNVASASLRNGDEDSLQVNSAGEVSVGSLLLITGPEVSCLYFVNKYQPYGKRFLLEVATAADATVQRTTQAA